MHVKHVDTLYLIVDADTGEPKFVLFITIAFAALMDYTENNIQ